MHYLTAVYWNRGNAASCNQDSLFVQQVMTRRGRVLMAAVCDGMGGLERGEIASGYLTERLVEWFYESLLRALQKKKPYWVIRRSLDRMVYYVQEQLQQYGRREGVELGTTMSALVLWENTYLLWHLGDSRIYRTGRKKSRRKERVPFPWKEQSNLSRKERYVQGRKGKRSGHEGRRSAVECMTRDHIAGRNRLTKCVGTFGYYRPDYSMGTVKAQEVFLLCSDGFCQGIGERELGDALEPGQLREEAQMERRLREIGETCMKRGGKDNLSAICIKALP
ncbi:MAG: serine/threonine-protein phosphatase [Clostridiales bacterium]|nr:serine/threonine-protein phosphatase [Clostridiales bacterium]